MLLVCRKVYPILTIRIVVPRQHAPSSETVLLVGGECMYPMLTIHVVVPRQHAPSKIVLLNDWLRMDVRVTQGMEW